MRSPVEALRRGALRTIATMNDISDDEESPSYAAIHAPASLSDAQRALNFIRAMEQGSNSGAVMSTNVDMVANALGRGDAYPLTDGSSSEVDETASEIKRRYRQSGQDEVSDPELWFFWTTVHQIQNQWRIEALWNVQVQSAPHLSWKDF